MARQWGMIKYPQKLNHGTKRGEFFLKNLKHRNSIPKDRQMGIIVLIHIKGDIRDCNNFRRIT